MQIEELDYINFPYQQSNFKEKEKMLKFYYDKDVDALYIKLSNKKPDGVIEIVEGVNLDTTEKGKIIGIEI